jgi:hypothetical protein
MTHECLNGNRFEERGHGLIENSPVIFLEGLGETITNLRTTAVPAQI